MIEDNENTTNSGEIQENEVEAVRNADGTFAKGNTGNLKGRPKGSRNKTVSYQLKQLIKEYDENTGMTYEAMMLKALLSKAIKKQDVRAIELVFNRTDGKVPQPIEFQDKSVLEKNLKVRELMEGFERMGDKWFLPKEEKND